MNARKKIIHLKSNINIQFTTYLCVFMIIFAIENHTMANNKNIDTSIWDFALPALDLNNVEINAVSLQDAWNQISTKYLLRSVLVISDNSLTGTSFILQSKHCSGADLLNALTAAYNDFMWSQDSNTGIIWFHPKDLSFDKILSSKIRVEIEQVGVPMQDGILQAIEDVPNGIRVRKWGTIPTNTFNYSVNLPAGEYFVRDLLNICCIANPNMSFYIQFYSKREPQFIIISAATLLPKPSISKKLTAPRPGILLFRSLEIGTPIIPSNEEIAAEMASSDPKIRWAACKYIESLFGSPLDFPFEKWMNISPSQEQALLVCIAGINTFVHSEDSTYTDGIKKMRTVNKDFFEKGEPNLAIPIALKLAQLTNDTNALNIVSQRKFPPEALKNIKSEINYTVRISSKVRNALRATGTNWLSESDSSFKDIDKISSKAEFIKNK
jgi:hypothetical protein